MGFMSKPRPAASVLSGLTLDDLLADLFAAGDSCLPPAHPPHPPHSASPSAGLCGETEYALDSYLNVASHAHVTQQAFAFSSQAPLRDWRSAAPHLYPHVHPDQDCAAPRSLSLTNPANSSPQSVYLAASAAAGFMAAAPPPPPPPPHSNDTLLHAAPSNSDSNSGSGSGPGLGSGSPSRSGCGSTSNSRADPVSPSLSPAMPVVKERRRPGKKPRAGRRFPCKICNSTFSRKDNLATHARVHTGERPYSCSICGRTFMWPSSARTHELTHTRVGRKRRGNAAVSAASVAATAEAPVAATAALAPMPAPALAPAPATVTRVPSTCAAPRTARGTFAPRAGQAAGASSSAPSVPASTVASRKIDDVSQRHAAVGQEPLRPHQPAQPVDLVQSWSTAPARPVPAPLPLAAMGRGEDALLSLEGLLEGNDNGYEQGAAVTPAQPPVVTGESPMFGAGVDARLSVDDLERCMENVLAGGSVSPPPPDSDHCGE